MWDLIVSRKAKAWVALAGSFIVFAAQLILTEIPHLTDTEVGWLRVVAGIAGSAAVGWATYSQPNTEDE